MIYELRLRALFKEKAQLIKAMQLIDGLKDKVTIINPGQPTEELSWIDIIENHHDQNPAAPCEMTFHWDNATGVSLAT